MKCEEALNYDQASQLLAYDPETGVLLWKVSNRRKIRAGDEAGGIKQNPIDGKRYLTVGILHRRYRAHRVAVLLMTGAFPAGEVDHINGNGLDNRWCNLRVVTRSENSRNMRRPENNKSGAIGVHWRADCRKWRAFIKIDGKQIQLGLFSDFNNAVAARKAAEASHSFHENHGSDRPL